MIDENEEITEGEEIDLSPGIHLNCLQLQWLMAHGGRSAKDVLVEKDKLYVLMSLAFGGTEKVFIPSDEEILEYLND